MKSKKYNVKTLNPIRHGVLDQRLDPGGGGQCPFGPLYTAAPM